MNIRMYDCQFGDCFRIDPEMTNVALILYNILVNV